MIHLYHELRLQVFMHFSQTAVLDKGWVTAVGRCTDPALVQADEPFQCCHEVLHVAVDAYRVGGVPPSRHVVRMATALAGILLALALEAVAAAAAGQLPACPCQAPPSSAAAAAAALYPGEALGLLPEEPPHPEAAGTGPGRPGRRGRIRGRPAAGSWPGGDQRGATRRAGTPPG